MQQYSDVVLVASVPGGPVRATAAASVQVNITGGAAATLYSDNGISTRANPIIADSSGEYSFYAANGTYDLVISVTGFTTETKTAAVQLFDAAASSGAAGVGFLPSGTGATAGNVQTELRRFVWPEHFGAVGDGTTDDRTALVNFFTACKDRKGRLGPKKYKITAAISIDPAYSYDIEGEGYDDNGAAASVIYNTGTGNALTIDNSGGTANDNLIRFSNFCINGTSSGLDGLYASDIPGLRLDRVMSTNNGGNGFRLQRCYNSELTGLLATHNGKHGIWLDKQCNAVVLNKCISNGNSRSDGFYNYAIIGTLAHENLGVTMIGCDATGAGNNPYTSVTAAYGIVVQYSHGVNIIGCYGEANKTANAYADSTVKNLIFVGNYQQDADTSFDTVDGLICENNVFTRVSLATRLVLAGPATKIRDAFNTYNGAATLDSGGVTGKYTVTNPTTDRALNVTADTLTQGLQVLGTLIADLQAEGVLK